MCMKPHSIFFMKNKKFLFLILTLIFCFNFFIIYPTLTPCYADTIDNSKEIYIVYNNEGKVVFEGNKVVVGDKIIDGNLNEYEVYFVDDSSQIAYADFNGRYQKPNIKKQSKGAISMNSNFIKKLETDKYYIGSFDAYQDDSKKLIMENSKLSPEETEEI